MAIAAGSRPKALSLMLALAVPAIALVPLAASGEPKPKVAAKDAGQADKAEKYDPDNVTAISQYMETVVKGTERYVAKDHTAAIDTYKKAIQLSPRNPLAHYLLAEAYLAANNLGEADAAIAQAYEADSKTATVRSHVLFLRAAIFERQKKWDDAKVAWQAYTEHAAKSGDAGVFPQTGAERVRAIQKVVELEKAYVAVRERIAAEKADAGKSPPKK
ncbi:MAG TPA: tetratricopeptide repeat protein [Labilithrix sp.]|nr:tetratricopeptide repeat protein [Labilithrix sp.]